VRWSSLLQSGQSSLWLFPAVGLSTNLNVKNAFLHGTLIETVYCSWPTSFIDLDQPNLVCLLRNSLYSLKHAPCVWYSQFASYLLSIGFTEAKSDTSLFLFHRGSETVFIALHQ
jgi:hypothetical protein